MVTWTTPKTWAAGVLPSADLNTYIRDNQNFLKTNAAWGIAAELTITAGIVTKTQSFHKIDTEGDAATDDLDTISGGSEGEVLVIRCESGARVVTVKNGTGNIIMDADVELNDVGKMLALIYDGSYWRALITPTGDCCLTYGIYDYCFYDLCCYS